MTIPITARRTLVLALGLLAAAAAVLLFARSDPAGAAATHTVRISADPRGGLKFANTRLRTVHGRVTLVMSNPRSSGLSHGIAIEGKGVDKDGKIVPAGGRSTVTVTLKKGTYEFYCPIPAHKKAGMTGHLVVS